MKIFKRIKDSIETNDQRHAIYKEHEDEFLVKALAELEDSHPNKALWAKALVESNGNESKARAKYIKKRCEQMVMDEEAARTAEAEKKTHLEKEKRERAERAKNLATQLYKQAHDLHYKRGSFDQAIMIYKRIMNNHPRSTEADLAQYQLDKLKLQGKCKEKEDYDNIDLHSEFLAQFDPSGSIRAWISESQLQDEFKRWLEQRGKA